MTYATWLALLCVALFAGAAWVAIWSRQDTWGRSLGVVLFFLGIPSIALAAVESLGAAKPLYMAWELEKEREYVVLSARMSQDVGIWIWLDTGEPEPRSYRLPWTNEMANKVQLALDGAPDGMEGQFIVKLDGTPDGEMTVHPIPQPAQPPAKDTPDEGLTYQQGE